MANLGKIRPSEGVKVIKPEKAPKAKLKQKKNPKVSTEKNDDKGTGGVIDEIV